MRKISLSFLAVLAVVVLGWQGTSSAATLWQIGLEDMSHLEFPADGTFYNPSFDYDVDLDIDPVNNPQAPSYLSTTNLMDIDPNRRPNNTTPLMNVNFQLDSEYDGLVLEYGRWGSENDRVFSLTLDQNFDQFVAGTAENVYGNYIFNLGSAGEGNHTLSFQYLGGGADNGHYYDYIRLSGQRVVPEPSTMILLGSGLMFGFTKKRKRNKSKA